MSERTTIEQALREAMFDMATGWTISLSIGNDRWALETIDSDGNGHAGRCGDAFSELPEAIAALVALAVAAPAATRDTP